LMGLSCCFFHFIHCFRIKDLNSFGSFNLLVYDFITQVDSPWSYLQWSQNNGIWWILRSSCHVV